MEERPEKSIALKLKYVYFLLTFYASCEQDTTMENRYNQSASSQKLKIRSFSSLMTMTLFTFTASCWLVTEAVLIPGKSIVNRPCYTEEEAVLNHRKTEYNSSVIPFSFFNCNVLCLKIPFTQTTRVEILRINIKL